MFTILLGHSSVHIPSWTSASLESMDQTTPTFGGSQSNARATLVVELSEYEEPYSSPLEAQV